MTPDTHKPDHENQDDSLRPHTYDGIQEYNKKLPNWWLATFYGSIIFAVAYYASYEWWKTLPDQATIVRSEMARIDAIKLASIKDLNDETLWKMSRNPAFVEAGRASYLANCASCHQPDLTGKIGPNLVDEVWIHGGKPTQVFATITNGVTGPGMPSWGPILGPKKVMEAAAFVLSHHKEPAK